MIQPTSSRPGRGARAAAKKRSSRRISPWPGRLGALAVIVPLAIFLLSSVIYLVHVYELVRTNLTPIVATEASRELGREVRLGRLSLAPLGRITLDKLSISDGPSFSHGTPALASAREVIISYSLASLLFDPGDAAHAIGTVTVSAPSLRVARLPDHSYNFSDLFENKPSTHHKPFVGTIVVSDGTVLFKDYLAPAIHGSLPAVNRVTGVSATVDFSSEKRVVFRAAGKGAVHGPLPQVAVRGSASRLKGSEYAIFVTASNAKLAYWSTYFKNFPQFHVIAGVGDGRIGMVRVGRSAAIDLTGDIAYRNAVVEVTDRRVVALPILGLTGSAHFNNASVQSTGSFVLNGQRVQAQGILYDFAHPQIEASGTFTHAGLPNIEAAIPSIRVPDGVTSAPINAQVTFAGSTSDPVIGANVSSPEIAFDGHNAVAFHAQGVFFHHVLVVPSATCSFPGGGSGVATLTVSGASAEPQIRAGGQIRGYDLAALLPPGPAGIAELKGRGDFDFIADNRAGPLTLMANVQSSGFSIHGVSVAEAAGRITWANNSEIHVDRFVGRSQLGTVALSGAVPVKPDGENWGLSIDATGLDLSTIARGFIAEPVQGIGSFHGTLSGPVSNPVVAGTGQVSGGRYANYTADTVSGQFSYSRDRLTMKNVDLRRYPTEAGVSGTVTGLDTQSPSTDISVNFQHADLEDITALAQRVQLPIGVKNNKLARGVGQQVNEALATLTGSAQGTLHISGHIADPNVTGETVVTDATLGAYRVDRARADFTYNRGDLKIRKGLVSIEDADITASGDYNTRSSHINAIFAATNFNLDRFKRYFGSYADVSGSVEFSGAINGTVQAPSASAGLVGHGVNIDGQQLADFYAFANYDDGIITQTGDPWVFTVLRQAQPNLPAGQTQYRINTFKLQLPTQSHPDRPVDFDMTADIPKDSPETVRHFVETIENSALSNTSFGQAILSAYNRLPQPFSGNLSASSIKIDGTPDALNVASTAHVDSLVVDSGRADNIDLTVDSEAGSKRTTLVTLNATGVDAAGLPLDQIALQGSMTGRTIALESLKADSDQVYLTANGSANLDGDINAGFDASGIPLATFNTFLPKSKALTGVLSSLSVTATGPTRSPDLTASVTLENPALTLRSVLATPAQVYSLDRVRSGAITLSSVGSTGDRILTISNLTAYKDHNPVATLSGSIPLKWTNAVIPALDLPQTQSVAAQLTVQDLGALAAVSPLIDPTRTGGSLTATLGPSATSPQELSGHVELSGGSIGLVGVDTALQNVDGDAVFDAGGFTITSLSGQSTDAGTLSVTGQGSFGPKPSISLSMSAKEFGINETGSQTLMSKLYSSSFRGKINGEVLIAGDPGTPVVSTKAGSPLLVSDAVGTIPTPPNTATTGAVVFPIDPRLNVAIQVGDRSKPARIVKSSLIQADVGGDVELGGKLSSPTITATFNAYKGQVLIPPSTPLKLVYPYGVVTITYPVPVTDALGTVQDALQTNVDLYAQAKVSVRPSTLAQYQSVGQGEINTISQQTPIVPGSALDTPVRYTIDAHIYGILGDPNNFHIDLTSVPADLNTNQMYAAIGGYSGLLSRDPQVALQDQMSAILSGVVLPGVFQPIEQSVENALGLDVFSVDYSNGEPLSLTLTKNLTSRFSLTYIQLLGSRDTAVVGTPALGTTDVNPLYTVELSYALSKRLQFSISTDSLNNVGASLQGEYGF